MSEQQFKSILSSILNESDSDANTDIDNNDCFEECTICLDMKLIKKTHCGCSTKYCHSCYEKVICTSGNKCTVCKNLLMKHDVQVHIPENFEYIDYSTNPESYQLSRTVNYTKEYTIPIFSYNYNILRMSGEYALRYSI